MSSKNSSLMGSMISLVSLAAVSMTAAAQVQDPLCKLNHHNPRVISWLPEAPSYFAKVHPEGKIAFYIGEGSNRVVNLEESDLNKRVQSIPGSIDPVPCPDGKLLTIPGLSLYEVSTLLKDGEAAKSIFEDSSNGGVYQSCAVLKTEGRYTTYRVITDASGEVAFRDYKVRYSTSHPATVEALGKAGLRCPKMNLKTIIVSKDGKYLSAYIPDVGTTKIFDISGNSGACREVADIGYATGKIEFNYDNTRIAFHVDYFSSQAGEYFSGVSSDMSKDVYTLDIEPAGNKLLLKNLRRLSLASRKGSGSYYPSFAKSGEISYLNDDDNSYAFHMVDPNKFEAFDPILPPPDGWPNGVIPSNVPNDWKARLHLASVMGSLWSKRCSEDDEEVSAAEAASVKLAMPQSTCLELVRETWKENTATELSKHVRFSRDKRFDPALIAQTTVDQLNQACRTAPDVNDPPAAEYGDRFAGHIDGPRAIQHYCTGCHVVGGSLRLPDGSLMPNTLNFRHLEEWQIEAALDKIDLPAGQGRMPPAGFEPPSNGVSHYDIVKDYLGCKLRQIRYTGDESGRPWCEGDGEFGGKGDPSLPHGKEEFKGKEKRE